MDKIKSTEIVSKIFAIRGIQVMLDFHIAEFFDVETKRLNEQVKRNEKRFPKHFMFQLNQAEWSSIQIKIEGVLRSQFATTKRRTLPYAFTEQGVAMLSSVLNSEIAIVVSIQIMDAFVKFRREIFTNSLIDFRLDKIESKQFETDKKFELVFRALEEKETTPSNGIFFEGQLFDAYVFANDLIKSANKSIILIDNYVDETTLLMLSKSKPTCNTLIYTQKISKQLELDLKKHNEQYPQITIKLLKTSHDRFLIIDLKELYHIGASLKDLGKKWFAFSKLNEFLPEILSRLDKD
jgi:hypothetical protein